MLDVALAVPVAGGQRGATQRNAWAREVEACHSQQELADQLGVIARGVAKSRLQKRFKPWWKEAPEKEGEKEREVLPHTVDSAHQVLLLLHSLDAHVMYARDR